MAPKSLLALALMATSAVARNALAGADVKSGKVELCGNSEPEDAHRAVPRRSSDELKAFNVDLVFHVVSSSETEDTVDDATIKTQIDIVNAAYAPHGISFNHVETTRTVNADWSAGSGIDDMKAALRQGGYSTLNVYTVGEIGGGVLGFCPFPVAGASEGSAAFLRDGCTINVGTMPGGDAAPYNQGGTLVHEIGHWMDVYHTFQDGCDPGDRVDDTPAMSSTPGRECDPNKVYDTCPNDPGTDPIHNWMNYTGDGCWEEFTPGQQERMYAAWETFRQ